MKDKSIKQLADRMLNTAPPAVKKAKKDKHM